MPLTSNRRDLREAIGTNGSADAAAGVRFFHGAAVVMNGSGYAEPATAATGLITVGVAVEHCDNRDGADGERRVKFERGIWSFRSGVGPDAVTERHLGRTVYWVDDATVSTVSTGRSAAGTVMKVNGGRIFVKVGQ